jgi:hypothetical protein
MQVQWSVVSKICLIHGCNVLIAKRTFRIAEVGGRPNGHRLVVLHRPDDCQKSGPPTVAILKRMYANSAMMKLGSGGDYKTPVSRCRFSDSMAMTPSSAATMLGLTTMFF